MASLHLESDTGEDAPQWIRDLRPSSSQLTIPVYPAVRDPEDPWAFKEEILLGDAIAVKISRTEKKKKKWNLNEVIKSSVEDLVPIPSESEGIPDKMCDVPFCENTTSLNALNLILRLLSIPTMIILQVMTILPTVRYDYVMLHHPMLRSSARGGEIVDPEVEGIAELKSY
ncbi:gypsy type transposase [Tanacetum coccineum]